MKAEVPSDLLECHHPLNQMIVVSASECFFSLISESEAVNPAQVHLTSLQLQSPTYRSWSLTRLVHNWSRRKRRHHQAAVVLPERRLP
jgi:hypothetical protein